MSEWQDSQKKTSIDFRKLLEERIDKVNPRLTLSAEEERRLSKLKAISASLRRGGTCKPSVTDLACSR